MFLIPFIVLGLNIEYLPDQYFAVSFKGVVNNFSVETFYMYMIYWENILVKLYSLFPKISWFGFMLLLYNIPITAILYISLNKILSIYKGSAKYLILSVVTIIWSMTLFYLGFTRTPFFVAGVTWLFIIVHYDNRNWLYDIVLGLFVASSTFMRYESMMASLYLLVPSLTFIYFNKKEHLPNVFKRIVFIFSLGFIGLFIHQKIYNQPVDQLIREYYDVHFNFFDAYQRVTSTNEKDSIRLQAMAMDFNADKDSLDIEQYKRLTIGNPLKIIDSKQIIEKSTLLYHGIYMLYLDCYYLFYFYGILLFLTILICHKDRKNLMLLFLNIIWGFLLIFAVIFFLKFVERVIQPLFILQLIPILSCLYFSKKSTFFAENKITLFVIIFLLGFSYFPFMNHYKNLSSKIHTQFTNNYETLVNLSKIHNEEKKDIILTNDGMELFITGLLDEWKPEDLIVYSFDSHINYLRGGEEALEKYSGSKHFIGFYEFISHQIHPAIIVSSEERMNMLKDYSKILYNYRFEVKNINNKYPHTLLNKDLNLNLYQLEVFQPF